MNKLFFGFAETTPNLSPYHHFPDLFFIEMRDFHVDVPDFKGNGFDFKALDVDHEATYFLVGVVVCDDCSFFELADHLQIHDSIGYDLFLIFLTDDHEIALGF